MIGIMLLGVVTKLSIIFSWELFNNSINTIAYYFDLDFANEWKDWESLCLVYFNNPLNNYKIEQANSPFSTKKLWCKFKL